MKGPKYREPAKIDFSKAKEVITNGLNDFIASSSNKFKVDKNDSK